MPGTEGAARAVTSSLDYCRVASEEDESQMDETDIPQRLSDEQVRDLLEQICGCRDSAQFQHQSFDRQRDIVAEAAIMGAAINQLAEFMLSTIETHHRPKLSASI